jgi:hypothetical protein
MATQNDDKISRLLAAKRAVIAKQSVLLDDEKAINVILTELLKIASGAFEDLSKAILDAEKKKKEFDALLLAAQVTENAMLNASIALEDANVAVEIRTIEFLQARVKALLSSAPLPPASPVSIELTSDERIQMNGLLSKVDDARLVLDDRVAAHRQALERAAAAKIVSDDAAAEVTEYTSINTAANADVLTQTTALRAAMKIEEEDRTGKEALKTEAGALERDAVLNVTGFSA